MRKIFVFGCVPGINGVMTCVTNLFRHMDRSIFEWEFIIPENPASEREDDYDQLMSLGAVLHRVDHSLRAGFTEKGKAQLNALLRNTPDLVGVHVHDIGTLNVYPIRAASEVGLPVKVIQSHASGKLKQKMEKNVTEWDRLFKERRSLISGDDVLRLACSDDAGDYLYGNLPFICFPNAIDLERFSYNEIYRSIIRKKLGIEDSSVVVGFPGHFFLRKNPVFAAKVFEAFHKSHPDSHMLLLGDGAKMAEVKSIFNKSGLAPFVHFLGYQTEIELFMNAMDIMLCTSFSEGLPYALVEAQATGLPCLISDNVSKMVCLTELAERISLEKTAEAWAEKIAGMLEKRTPRRSYTNELRSQGYDIRENAEELGKLYTQNGLRV